MSSIAPHEVFTGSAKHPSVLRSEAGWDAATEAVTDVYRPVRVPHRGGGYLPPRVDFQEAARLGDVRVVCGNLECPSRWLKFWKDRRRPVFEGQWSCSGGCLKRLVEASVRREFGEGRTLEDNVQHRHRVPLGLVLLAQGWITNPQLQHALEVQRRAGSGRIGYWLIEECGLEEDLVTRGLSMQWGCPVLRMEGFDPERMALVVPKVMIERLGLVPTRIAAGRILYLAFEDQMDAAATFAIERMSGLKVESGLADASQLKMARQRLLESEFVDVAQERVEDAESLSTKIASALGRMQPRASRLVRVHQFYWLRMWLERGAMGARDGGIPATKEDVLDRIYTIGVDR